MRRMYGWTGKQICGDVMSMYEICCMLCCSMGFLFFQYGRRITRRARCVFQRKPLDLSLHRLEPLLSLSLEESSTNRQSLLLHGYCPVHRHRPDALPRHHPAWGK